MSVIKFARGSSNVIAVSLVFAYIYGAIPVDYETPALIAFLVASIFSVGSRSSAYF